MCCYFLKLISKKLLTKPKIKAHAKKFKKFKSPVANDVFWVALIARMLEMGIMIDNPRKDNSWVIMK